MAQGYFVTGTDTHVGKTWASASLMRAGVRQGFRVVGMKPVASGCEWHEGSLQNSDALCLLQQGNVALDYASVNPFAYEPAIAPNFAGIHNPASLEVIKTQYEQLASQAELVIVEGAGGWYSPLSMAFDNALLAEALAIPVILVVGIRLGCINHARLSLAAIQQSKANCCGWIAVRVEPDLPYTQENIAYLRKQLSVPLLGILPYLREPDFDKLASAFSINNHCKINEIKP